MQMPKLSKFGLAWIAAVMCLLLATPPATGQDAPHIWLPLIARQPTVSTALCRFGVNHHGGSLDGYDMTALQAGTFVDYRADPVAPGPNGMEHFRMIRLSQQGADGYSMAPDMNTVQALAAADPGAVWLIGNEPDRRVYQDDMEPLPYAVAYHDIYWSLNAVDPTARVFAGNIVQATPLRLKYLDQVLAAYQQRFGASLPVDGWSIHAFILNERRGEWGADIPPGLTEAEGQLVRVDQNADIDLFKAQITNFRQWMLNNGYRNQPLYVTEYGVLMPAEYGFPPAVVNSFMTQSFDFMLNQRDAATGYPYDDNRLVQRFSWYSISDKIRWDESAGTWFGFNGYLFDPDFGNARSAMGNNYAQYAQGLAATADVLAGAMSSELAPIGASRQLTVTVNVHNAGNTTARQPYMVSFYLGAPQAGGQLLPPPAQLTGEVGGCADYATVRYVWREAPAGTHRIFAVVSPWGGVADVNPNNNTNSITVTTP